MPIEQKKIDPEDCREFTASAVGSKGNQCVGSCIGGCRGNCTQCGIDLKSFPPKEAITCPLATAVRKKVT